MVLSGPRHRVVGVHHVGVQGHVAGVGGGLQSTLCSSLPSTGLSGGSPRWPGNSTLSHASWRPAPVPCSPRLPRAASRHTSQFPASPCHVYVSSRILPSACGPWPALHVPLPSMLWLPGLPVVPLGSFIKFLAARALTMSPGECSVCCTSLSSFSPPQPCGVPLICPSSR